MYFRGDICLDYEFRIPMVYFTIQRKFLMVYSKPTIERSEHGGFGGLPP